MENSFGIVEDTNRYTGYLSRGKLDIKINYCKVAQPFQLLFSGIASLKMSLRCIDVTQHPTHVH